MSNVLIAISSPKWQLYQCILQCICIFVTTYFIVQCMYNCLLFFRITTWAVHLLAPIPIPLWRTLLQAEEFPLRNVSRVRDGCAYLWAFASRVPAFLAFSFAFPRPRVPVRHCFRFSFPLAPAFLFRILMLLYVTHPEGFKWRAAAG